jgi:hypothetical protein
MQKEATGVEINGFKTIAPRIAGKEIKIIGWKKGIHLLRRYKKGIIHRYTFIVPINI